MKKKLPTNHKFCVFKQKFGLLLVFSLSGVVRRKVILLSMIYIEDWMTSAVITSTHSNKYQSNNKLYFIWAVKLSFHFLLYEEMILSKIRCQLFPFLPFFLSSILHSLTFFVHLDMFVNEWLCCIRDGFQKYVLRALFK